jgi:hypothetical protein
LFLCHGFLPVSVNGWRFASGPCRQHGSDAFAKADARRPGLFTPAANHDGIAVFEVGAALAVGQLQRILSTGGQLNQRAGLVQRRARQGAAAEQVAKNNVTFENLCSILCLQLNNGLFVHVVSFQLITEKKEAL